jgi:peptidyl-prolyl cis-trans isomerase SurA
MERADMTRRVIFGLAALMMAISVPVAPAFAQSAVATVNGEPITERDIQQRTRINSMIFRSNAARPAILQELIDDKVKMAEARRIGMRPTQAFLDDSISRLATSNRQTANQFEQNLVKAGIDPEALKAKLGTEAIWGELLRQRARSNSVSNAELDAEMERRVAKGEAKLTDFVIRQVVFVVPPGTNPGARESAANAARGRFNDCETGVEYLRTLPDVAVRERVGRTSTDLPEQTVALLNRTGVGKMTPPFRSAQGIEMIAVCEKTEREDRLQLRNRIEQELIGKRTQGSAAQYLNDLRAKVEIRR